MKKPKPRWHPGDVVGFKGDQYLVTGWKHKPALKLKKLVLRIREFINASIH